MNYLRLCVSGVLILGLAQAQDNTLKEDISSAISEVFTMGKETLSGVVDGIEKGRSVDTKALDKFVVVSDKVQLNKSVKLNAHKFEALGNQRYKLTLALTNTTDQGIRITGLNSIKALILIDNEGFAAPLELDKAGRKDIIIFERSATKASFVFTSDEGVPKYFRMLGEDVLLPEATPASQN